MSRQDAVARAIDRLAPGAEWALRGDQYSDLEWLDQAQPKPDEVTLMATADEIEGAAPVPEDISDRQFYQMLAIEDTITEAEALEAVQIGRIPAALQAMIDTITDPADRFSAQMLLSGATVFRRSHPLTVQIGLLQGRSAGQIDDFWRAAALL